jgi:carbonic anhydrase
LEYAAVNKLENLFANNRLWVDQVLAQDPEFFRNLARQQSPEYLWIGCSDSRVPANEITGLAPGEVFVHRNIANVIVHTDLNALSVIQFAVDMLKVKHIMVVGHYGCSGVQAALRGTRVGVADNWLRHVQDVHKKHQELFTEAAGENLSLWRLCELNVLEQVVNLCSTTVVQDAWLRGQELTIHGWVYGIHNGLLHDLDLSVESLDQVEGEYQRALSLISSRF